MAINFLRENHAFPVEVKEEEGKSKVSLSACTSRKGKNHDLPVEEKDGEEKSKVSLEQTPSTCTSRKRKNPAEEIDEEGRSEVSLELTLSTYSSRKRKRNFFSSDFTHDEYASVEIAPAAKSTSCNGMRSYGCRDDDEEDEKRVSTKLKMYEDPWAIKKVLTASDVNNSCRLLLSTQLVEDHIIKMMAQPHVAEIKSGAGMKVGVWDYDTMSKHELTFKRWPSTGSYVLLNNWKKDFEKRRRLRKGDEIGLFWHPFDSILCFRVLTRNS